MRYIMVVFESLPFTVVPLGLFFSVLWQVSQIAPSEAFVMPGPISSVPPTTLARSSYSILCESKGSQKLRSSSSLGITVGLGPDPDSSSTTTTLSTERVIVGEDGLPLPIITDHEPYRRARLSKSDEAADEWYRSLLESSGPSFLGPVSVAAIERILQKTSLVDEPRYEYGHEEWTPYSSRRLPTSPLYPAYGLETFGLPVLRTGAEAWRHFDVNGLVGMDYSGRPTDIGKNLDLTTKEVSDITTCFKKKGSWLDDDSCIGRLVYINGRFCPSLSKQTNLIKNLDSTFFNENSSLSEEILPYLSRLTDGFTDELPVEVLHEGKGTLTSFKKLSGPDHCVGEPTSQFAINNQQGTAAFVALNLVKAGCVAYIEVEEEEKSLNNGSSENGVLPKPVLIINAFTPSGQSASTHQDGTGVSIHPRTLAIAKDRSVLSLIQCTVDLDENSTDENPRATFVNGVTQIFVGNHANVTHSYLEESGGTVTSRVEMTDAELNAINLDIDNTMPDSFLPSPREVEAQRPALRNTIFETIDVHVMGKEGHYSTSILELGGCGRSRIALSTSLLRPGATATINGFALSGGLQRTDMRTNIHHIAQGTISRQEQRNLVGGRSTASFRGRIRVEQSAQQTDSGQLSRTVLLSDHARIWTIPCLEIIADDIKCTHGATVSDLSEEELFYLRCRGLDLSTARNILMYSFVDEVSSKVENSIVGDFDDENGLRSRIIKRLELLAPQGEKILIGGEFQSV